MLLALLLVSSPPAALDLQCVDVFSRSVPPRTRSLIRVDPVEEAILKNTLTTEGWTKRANPEWTEEPAGYVWFRVQSPRHQVVQLNVAGASMAYVNGEPRVGDVYSYGTFFVAVSLKEGINDILATGLRGNVTLNWRKPAAEIEIDPADATLPDFNAETGEPHGEVGGFVIRNNSSRPRRVTIGVDEPNLPKDERLIPPFGTVKSTIRIPNNQKFEVILNEGRQTLHRQHFELAQPAKGESFRRTFVSKMDGSAQYYAVNPASEPRPKVLVLSLHGASVEAIGQARAYGAKAFADIVCPTNRRPFGFNWETVGRRDALEVLDHARSLGAYDSNRTMLTGHSMGGHGAWHLGVHHATQWAAVGPCAGWISFDTYGGGANYNLSDPVQAQMARANLLSQTLEFKENLRLPSAVYIHHGAADETVPVTEARRMREELKGIANVLYHEEPGGGHWFDNNPEPGADSVDWKPMFQLFARAERPTWYIGDSRRFVLADPSIQEPIGPIDQWIAQRPMQKAIVDVTYNGDHYDLKTQNLLAIRCRFGMSRLKVDGQTFSVQSGDVLERAGETWSVKGRGELPQFARGFHELYQNEMVMIAPTNGSGEEQRWAWAKIRFDQEQLWYRANATPRLFRETDSKIPSGNRLHYGTSFQRAWTKQRGAGPALPELPILADSATFAMRVTNRGSVWGTIQGQSALGRRLTERFPLFAPGAGFPEYLVATPNLLSEGATGIHRAGFWGPRGEMSLADVVIRK